MTSEPSVLLLGDQTLDALADRMSVPTYDRSGLRPSIVHIGVGGFHRAHLATYVDELCRAGNKDWAIIGSGVMPNDAVMAEALGNQDGLYTLITRGPTETHVEVMGSIIHYIHAAEQPQALIDQIAAPDTQIVSLTVTEGGYPVDDVTGEYSPDSTTAGPGSAFHLIAQGLEARRRHCGAPITVISCDNIMSNGHVARTATLGEAAQIDADLVAWIDEAVSFPNSMVDRITPATTDADRSWLAESAGLNDRWPVVTEAFRQWIIEDDFAGERLPLEELDVIVTGDVEPYEHMKLRLLNAGHSCLAYLAALLDISTVDAAMADDDIASFVSVFLDREAKPVVPAVKGIDVDDYIASLIERFSNPNIADQISRLCLDGSAKFPKFLLPTIRAELAVGGPVDHCALALAGWCQYLLATTESGAPIELASDPQLADAQRFAEASEEDPAAFLAWPDVFGADIGGNAVFREAFTSALKRLRTDGVRSAISAAQ